MPEVEKKNSPGRAIARPGLPYITDYSMCVPIS